MEEQLTLFGPLEGAKEIKRKSRDEVFNDYNAFLDKFATKLTTDDCYTPAPVYDAVVDFVRSFADIEGKPIVRPFYPGGDYEAFAYPEDCVVIDNPPFSILSKILRFYSLHKVPFFLFAPALTLFSAPDCDLTYIVAGADVIYENGAHVSTSFITNMHPDLRVWVCPQIYNAVTEAQATPSKAKKGFQYPDNLITAATLTKLAAHNTELQIKKSACQFVKSSDAADRVGRALFGGGFLLSERAAAERAAATKLLLSEREQRIIARLSKND